VSSGTSNLAQPTNLSKAIFHDNQYTHNNNNTRLGYETAFQDEDRDKKYGKARKEREAK